MGNHRFGQDRVGWCGGGEGHQKLLSLWGGIRVTTYLILPQLKATDADEGEFGRVWYRILQGEWAAWEGKGQPFCL